MGLRATLKALLNPDQRTTRKAHEHERHAHCRRNAGLLEIALKRGRMRSFTPDDLPAFYRAQRERAEREERERKSVEREAASREGERERERERHGVASSEKNGVELGKEVGDAVLIVPEREEAGVKWPRGTAKEERRGAVVVPVD